jgi:hypothetical protein
MLKIHRENWIKRREKLKRWLESYMGNGKKSRKLEKLMDLLVLMSSLKFTKVSLQVIML